MKQIVPNLNRIQTTTEQHLYVQQAESLKSYKRLKRKEEKQTRLKNKYFNKLLVKICKEIKQSARQGLNYAIVCKNKFNSSPFSIAEIRELLKEAFENKGYRIKELSYQPETAYYYDYLYITISWEVK